MSAYLKLLKKSNLANSNLLTNNSDLRQKFVLGVALPRPKGRCKLPQRGSGGK